MSVRLSVWNNYSHTGFIFVKFGIFARSENMYRSLNFYENLTRITSTLHEDKHTFTVIPRSVILRMKNVLDKFYRENQNTHFTLSNIFKNLTVYEIMWKNIVETGRSQMAMRRTRIACRIANGTGT